jgi:hypothetical protein
VPLLESGDAEAIDVVEQNRALLSAAFGAALEAVESALGDFEFDDALSALRAAVSAREA